MAELLYPTPEYVKGRRKSLNLTAAELSRMMGFSEGYVSGVEQETVGVSAEFARRFWAVFNGNTRVIVSASIPAVEGLSGVLHVSRLPKRCACGCREWFVPNSWNHAFVDRTHQRKGRVG